MNLEEKVNNAIALKDEIPDMARGVMKDIFAEPKATQEHYSHLIFLYNRDGLVEAIKCDIGTTLVRALFATTVPLAYAGITLARFMKQTRGYKEQVKKDKAESLPSTTYQDN